MESRYIRYAPLFLRVPLAGLFLLAGIGKLLNPGGPTGMLQSLGFPVAGFFAWVLLLSEIVFGLSILVGWKVKYTAWPLAFILLVAVLLVTLPSGNWSSVFFHLLGIGSLVSLTIIGSGALSADRS